MRAGVWSAMSHDRRSLTGPHPARSVVEQSFGTFGEADVSVDWEAFRVWALTIITAASALVAVASYRRSLYDKKREQASRVAAWFTQEAPIALVPVDDGSGAYSAVVAARLHVANRSQEAIYAVHVQYAMPVADRDTARETEPAEVAVPEIGPGIVAHADIAMHFAKDFGERSRPDAGRAPWATFAPVTIVFTDALGRRWRRRGSRPVRLQRRWYDEPPATRLHVPVVPH
jgi:hypothetical protein